MEDGVLTVGMECAYAPYNWTQTDDSNGAVPIVNNPGSYANGYDVMISQIICDIYSRFLFESSVFEARPQEFLDADRLCQLMLEAQKKAYGDGLDQSCLHPYMWLCKGHYYSGSLSFYNFPYAFGGLFARGLYAKYQQEGKDFVPLYKKMLHATSVTCVEDTAKIAGIDLTDKAFWRQGLQSLADEIDLFCQLVK
mgnify:CR=1 FL=1